MRIPGILIGLAGIVLSSAGTPAWVQASPPDWPVPRYGLSAAPGDGALDKRQGEAELLDKALPTAASSFVGIPPCRMVDTRGNGFNGPYGPPSLIAEIARDFGLAGRCGVPANAVAASLNFTVVAPTGDGFLATFPAAGSVPLVSTLNFRAGQVLANAAIVPLGTDGAITVYASGASTHLLIDVNGYFMPPPVAQKICSVLYLNSDGWIESLSVPAVWTGAMCNNHRLQIAPTNSTYQLSCLTETGVAVGANGGGLPTPNCGW